MACRRTRYPRRRALSNFLRITAGSFATSLTTTFWDRREALHQTRLSDTISVYAPAYQQSLAQLHQFGLNDQAAAGAMTQGMIGQSYLLSSLDLFYFSAWLCVALIPLCFLVRRPAAGRPYAGGGGVTYDAPSRSGCNTIFQVFPF